MIVLRREVERHAFERLVGCRRRSGEGGRDQRGDRDLSDETSDRFHVTAPFFVEDNDYTANKFALKRTLRIPGQVKLRNGTLSLPYCLIFCPKRANGSRFRGDGARHHEQAEAARDPRLNSEFERCSWGRRRDILCLWPPIPSGISVRERPPVAVSNLEEWHDARSLSPSLWA